MQEKLIEADFETRLRTLMRLGNCPLEIARDAILQQDLEAKQRASETFLAVPEPQTTEITNDAATRLKPKGKN